MKFVDEIQITVNAGHGGAGCVSFLREKYKEFGGPDGGDGGRGGDIWLEVNPSLQSLGHLVSKKSWQASDGKPGRGSQKSGADAESTIIQLPVGTEVVDLDSETVLCDLAESNMRLCIARGGMGGRGNQHFASSVNHTPEYAQSGLPGEQKNLILRLKLLADVGLVGLPNAGKSTLLAAVSHKLPKIADYAFTTLTPNIGVVEDPEPDSYRRLLLADIPGIIEGASKGHGLGLSFLRHIERVQVIVYVIDGSDLEAGQEIDMLQEELRSYSPRLLELPALLVLNKIDQFEYDLELARQLLRDIPSPALKNIPESNILFLSAAHKWQTTKFVQALFQLLGSRPTLAELANQNKKPTSVISNEQMNKHTQAEHIVIKHQS